MLNFRLFPFTEADGGTTGATPPDDGSAGTTPTDSGSAGTGNPPDGAKTGDDIEAKAQKIADAMLAKKMKNMPSKEEFQAFKKWQDEQKTEAQRIADAQKQIEHDKQDAQAQLARANAMVSVIKAGIKAEKVEDAIILAMARTTDELSVEDAIKKIADENPSWKTGGESGQGASLPNGGSNPAAGIDEGVLKIKRHF